MKGYGYLVLTIAVVTLIYAAPMAHAITLPLKEVVASLANVNALIGG